MANKEMAPPTSDEVKEFAPPSVEELAQYGGDVDGYLAKAKQMAIENAPLIGMTAGQIAGTLSPFPGGAIAGAMGGAALGSTVQSYARGVNPAEAMKEAGWQAGYALAGETVPTAIAKLPWGKAGRGVLNMITPAQMTPEVIDYYLAMPKEKLKEVLAPGAYAWFEKYRKDVFEKLNNFRKSQGSVIEKNITATKNIKVDAAPVLETLTKFRDSLHPEFQRAEIAGIDQEIEMIKRVAEGNASATDKTAYEKFKHELAGWVHNAKAYGEAAGKVGEEPNQGVFQQILNDLQITGERPISVQTQAPMTPVVRTSEVPGVGLPPSGTQLPIGINEAELGTSKYGTLQSRSRPQMPEAGPMAGLTSSQEKLASAVPGSLAEEDGQTILPLSEEMLPPKIVSDIAGKTSSEGVQQVFQQLLQDPQHTAPKIVSYKVQTKELPASIARTTDSTMVKASIPTSVLKEGKQQIEMPINPGEMPVFNSTPPSFTAFDLLGLKNRLQDLANYDPANKQKIMQAGAEIARAAKKGATTANELLKNVPDEAMRAIKEAETNLNKLHTFEEIVKTPVLSPNTPTTAAEEVIKNTRNSEPVKAQLKVLQELTGHDYLTPINEMGTARAVQDTTKNWINPRWGIPLMGAAATSMIPMGKNELGQDEYPLHRMRYLAPLALLTSPKIMTPLAKGIADFSAAKSGIPQAVKSLSKWGLISPLVRSGAEAIGQDFRTPDEEIQQQYEGGQ